MILIAHRGASGYCLENTMASFEKALEMGATMIELDVQLTADEKIVVYHDFELGRIVKGEGFIKDQLSEDLVKLDIPLLEDVLDLVPSDVVINVEIKRLGIDRRDVAQKVYTMVEEKGRLESITFSAFDHQILLDLQSLGAKRLGLLLDSGMVRPWDYMQSIGLHCISINQSKAFIHPQFVEQAHAHGYQVFSYTVNEPQVAKAFETFGVDGIFTNYLDILNKE
ncbi:glycerophosphodiester phosphodiesterase family protein [Vallitaleaceae bacterium 9-2]